MKCIPEDMSCLENVGSVYNILRYDVELIVTIEVKRIAMVCVA